MMDCPILSGVMLLAAALIALAAVSLLGRAVFEVVKFALS